MARTGDNVPNGFRIGVLGSTKCHHAETQSSCVEIGAQLPTDAIVVTGGLPGPPRVVIESFSESARIVHLLPHLSFSPKRGMTIRAGWTMGQRRRQLADFCDIYICIEGGPGTRHETALIARRNAPILPVAKHGGHAKTLFASTARPAWASLLDWNTLGGNTSNAKEIAEAVRNLLVTFRNQLAIQNVKRWPPS